MNVSKTARRRRTRRWFAFYTLALAGIVVASVWMHEWSVAVTTLAIAVIFALFTRRAWRTR